jgi:hypothetical protein
VSCFLLLVLFSLLLFYLIIVVTMFNCNLAGVSTGGFALMGGADVVGLGVFRDGFASSGYHA